MKQKASNRICYRIHKNNSLYNFYFRVYNHHGPRGKFTDMYAEEYNSATLAEIYNQARSAERTIELAPHRFQVLSPLLPLDRYSDIIITGCGSSHHLALCASFAWSEMLGRPVAAVASSELMNFADHYLARTARPLIIAISRSGGTTEVRLAVERLRHQYNATALAITGEPGGSVASVCHAEIAFTECYERSVVMTQAFTSILTGLYLLADGAGGWTRLGEIERIPQSVAASLEPSEQVLRPVAEDQRTTRFFFLGSGAMKGLADESALKLTEMALETALSYRSLEFRHGPKATLNRNDKVIIFPVESERPHLDTLLAEIEDTQASALVVEQGSLISSSRRVLTISGDLPEIFRPALLAHVGQLLAYWRAAARDMNPDTPPHLARTVLLNV
jgi:glutamine---fructose-6-phosphate transaminase (isomerizing)